MELRIFASFSLFTSSRYFFLLKLHVHGNMVTESLHGSYSLDPRCNRLTWYTELGFRPRPSLSPLLCAPLMGLYFQGSPDAVQTSGNLQLETCPSLSSPTVNVLP